MRLSAFTMCPPTRNASHKFSAFKAFVLPENHADHARAEVERIHEYCDRVDRERYTNEHRRQLRYLLSSSSASGSSSASPPPEETTTGSKTVQIHNHRVSFQKKDMSELSITDSGISSMYTASEKSSTTTPPMERVVQYK
ncbi:unnamed protein product [Lymnaea stagnalis]|uniref:Uncharacterized protein n=1 Tax=Lymnaea stagnalis TaxID=6523 RepID=A0AAV2I9P3_LYMST